MSKIKSAVEWALSVAADSSHGYDQAGRWGPDYDCSSLVISAWEQAGVPVKSQGGATYTGNMKRAFLAHGFVELSGLDLSGPAGLAYGDVLLHERNHTAMYIGAGQIVQASINELGTIKGGAKGDQTGGEIAVRSYYNYPWDCVLRYAAEEAPEVPASEAECGDACAVTIKTSIELPEVYNGAIGGAVLSVQNLLIHKWGIALPRYGADGEFGAETEAGIKTLQRTQGLEVDGVVGRETWAALIGG